MTEWGRRTGGWITGMCGSIGRYEDGVIDTILPDAKHSYESRHTLGNETCRLFDGTSFISTILGLEA
jgi:hypothetical protein